MQTKSGGGRGGPPRGGRGPQLIVLEQAPVYDENLAKIGPASPGEMMMIAGRSYNHNFDRAENLIDYIFEKLLDYNLLENLFDENLLKYLFDYNFEKLLDYNLLENLIDYDLLEYLFDYNRFEKLLEHNLLENLPGSNLIDYSFEKLLDYNLLENLLDYNLLANICSLIICSKICSIRINTFVYNLEKLLDHILFENICSLRISTNIILFHFQTFVLNGRVQYYLRRESLYVIIYYCSPP